MKLTPDHGTEFSFVILTIGAFGKPGSDFTYVFQS